MLSRNGRPLVFKSALTLCEELVSSLASRSSTPTYPTGLADLDAQIFGLHPGELTVISARPSHGKTSLALQMAWHLASVGRRVIFVSLEMSAASVLERIFAQELQLPGWRLRKGEGIATALGVTDKFRARLLTRSFEILDQEGYTIDRIERVLEELRPECLFIDHVQKITRRGFASKYDALAQYINRLQTLAIAYRCVIVMNSQLSRGATREESGLDYHKGAGEIEENADCVLTCRWLLRHHRQLGLTSVEPPPNKYLIRIEKQRYGPTDDVYVFFDPVTYSFRNWREEPCDAYGLVGR